MGEAIKALDQIGAKVGILACLLVGWMYLQITDLNEKVEKLDRTTADLSEMKQDISAINAKLEMIVKLNLNGEKK